MRYRSFRAGAIVFLFVATFALTGCGGGNSTAQTPLTTAVTPSGTPNQPPSPTPTPTPPPPPPPSTPTGAGLTVMNNVEDTPNWLTCGACGNAGGTGAVPVSSVAPGMATPSEDGRSTEFSIAASVPFTNTYWFQKHTALHTQFDVLTYEFDLFVPTASATAPQAIEFECQQTLGGWVYNFSWQADYASKQWRIFNYTTKHWEQSGIALTPFTPGAWHHVLAEYHSDSATHTLFHDALTVDGVRFPVNITHVAFFSGDTNDQFTNAFQLDSNTHPDAYSVYVDQMKITYK